MSLSRNFRKGRSHIIFIVGLLTASAVILALDLDERQPNQAATPATIWEELPSPSPAPQVEPDAPIPDASTAASKGQVGSGRIEASTWQVQLGAFSTPAAAQRQWQNAKSLIEDVRGLQPAFVRRSSLTALRAGPIQTRAQAERLCELAAERELACMPVES